MITVTTEHITGKEAEELGVVKGNTTQIIPFKTIVGGELEKYNEMLDKARDAAMQHMVDEAEKLGADAIVSVRFDTSYVWRNAVEILAYGTAVKLNN